MKSKFMTRFVALFLALALTISLTSVSSFAAERKDMLSVGDAVEAFYVLDGEQPMIKEIHNDADDVYAAYETNFTSWAYAYDILSEEDDMEAEVTWADLAEILYHYAKHHDVDVTANGQMSAIDWAVSCGLIPADSEEKTVAPNDLVAVLSNYNAADLPKVGVVADGLTLLYPSEGLTTINPLCDFYVVGDIDPSVTVPDNAQLSVQLRTSSGYLIRDVYTTKKDNQEGLNVYYSGLVVAGGNREAFRASMMPDIVYDPNFPESFGYTWIKAYYTDEHFTSVIYGGAYEDDVYPYDQYYQKLDPLPEGDYELTVWLTYGTEILASLSTQITVGVIAQKTLGRFSPDSYFNKLEEYSIEQGYTVYTDPFPGAWSLPFFFPEWNLDYIGNIPRRWRLVDRMGYTGGMTYFFDYNISATSTSYSVELGQIGYIRNLDNPENLTYVYWDIGEPEIQQQGTTYTGQFVEKNVSEMDDIVFTRVDYSPIISPENTITPAILNETTSVFDLSQPFTVSVGDFISINGLCRQIQPEQVTLNQDGSITMGNRIVSIRYTFTLGTGERYQVLERGVELTRTFEDGSTSTAILEFRNNFLVTRSLAGRSMTITAEALDAFGNVVSEPLYVCEYFVAPN